MKCHDYRAQLPDFWDGALAEQERADLELHLASCALCSADAQQLSTLWHRLGSMPQEEPSRAMRVRFYDKLDAYQQGFGNADPAHRGRTLLQAFLHWWTARPALQFGLSLATLAIGFLVGYRVDNSRDSARLQQLQAEVGSMKQLVTLSLLQQQSASERLKGINFASRVESPARPDTEVLAALLYTVNHDPNVNVRLAAVDALRLYADSPLTRKGLVQAIAKQQSPMVQVALIDQLADIHDQNTVPTLKALSNDPQANPEVRQRASWALGKLQ